MRLLLLSVAIFVGVSAAAAQQPTPADFYAARDRARHELGWTSGSCAGRPDLTENEFAVLHARLAGALDAPRLIWVYLRQGNRIFLADADLAAKFAALAACDARREAIDAFNACWKERGRDQPAFAAAHWQAQALDDALAAR